MSNLIRGVDEQGNVESYNAQHQQERLRVLEENSLLGGSGFEGVAIKAIQDALGLEGGDKVTYKHKVNDIFDYVRRQTNDYTPKSVLRVIQELENKLGSPPLSERRVNWLSRYARLSQSESASARRRRSTNDRTQKKAV